MTTPGSRDIAAALEAQDRPTVPVPAEGCPGCRDPDCECAPVPGRWDRDDPDAREYERDQS